MPTSALEKASSRNPTTADGERGERSAGPAEIELPARQLRCVSMRQRPPTWQLVLDAAQQFSRSGQSPFALGALIEEVQRVDRSRDRTSIQPIVQGMTVNAGAGPQQPCGQVLERVSRGYYALRDGAAPITSPTPHVRYAQRGPAPRAAVPSAGCGC